MAFTYTELTNFWQALHNQSLRDKFTGSPLPLVAQQYLKFLQNLFSPQPFNKCQLITQINYLAAKGVFDGLVSATAVQAIVKDIQENQGCAHKALIENNEDLPGFISNHVGSEQKEQTNQPEETKFAASSTSEPLTNEPSFLTTVFRGCDYLEADDLDNALLCFQLAVKQMHEENIHRDYYLNNIYLNMTEVYLRQRNYRLGIEHFKLAQKHATNYDKKHEFESNFYYRLFYYYHFSSSKQASLERALAIASLDAYKKIKPSPNNLEKINLLIACLYQTCDSDTKLSTDQKFTYKVKYLKIAIQLKLLIFINNNGRTAKCTEEYQQLIQLLQEYSKYCQQENDLQKAIAIWQQAIEYQETVPSTQATTCIHLYLHLKKLHLENNNRLAAIAAIQHCLKLTEQVKPTDDVLRQRSDLFIELRNLHKMLGNTEQSDYFLSISIAEREKIASKNVADLHMLLNFQIKTGDNYAKKYQIDIALRYYKKAINCYQQLIKKQSCGSLDFYYKQIAYLYQKMCEFCCKQHYFNKSTFKKYANAAISALMKVSKHNKNSLLIKAYKSFKRQYHERGLHTEAALVGQQLIKLKNSFKTAEYSGKLFTQKQPDTEGPCNHNLPPAMNTPVYQSMSLAYGLQR